MRRYNSRYNAPIASRSRVAALLLLLSYVAVVLLVHVEGRSCRREFERTSICPDGRCTQCLATLVVGVDGTAPSECARVGSRRCCSVAIDEEACLTNVGVCEWDVRRNGTGGRCRRIKGNRRGDGGGASTGTTGFASTTTAAPPGTGVPGADSRVKCNRIKDQPECDGTAGCVWMTTRRNGRPLNGRRHRCRNA